MDINIAAPNEIRRAFELKVEESVKYYPLDYVCQNCKSTNFVYLPKGKVAPNIGNAPESETPRTDAAWEAYDLRSDGNPIALSRQLETELRIAEQGLMEIYKRNYTGAAYVANLVLRKLEELRK